MRGDPTLSTAVAPAGARRSFRPAALVAAVFLCLSPLRGAAQDAGVAATWERAQVALPRSFAQGRPLLGLTADPAIRAALAAHAPEPRGPAVLVLHGCNGIGLEEQNLRLILQEQGYPVFMPDSFARTERRANCAVNTGATALAPEALGLRLEEIDYALGQLSALGFVDRVFLVGYSEGGQAVARQARSPLPVAGVVVLGWHCQGREPGVAMPPAVPVLAVIGDSDPWYRVRPGLHCGEVIGARGDAQSIVLPANGHAILTSPIAGNAERARNAIVDFLKAR